MTICCVKESGSPSSDSDGDDNTNLEIPKLSDMLSPIHVGDISVQKVVVKSSCLQNFTYVDPLYCSFSEKCDALS